MLRRPIPYAPRARLNSERRHRRSAGHIFSVLAEKIWKKRPLGRNSAVAQKRHFDSAYHSPMARPARNALRAAVESGFPSARYTVRVASFAPVEYLTYGSRGISNTKRFVGADAPSARLHRRVFRLPRRSDKLVPVARFVNSKCAYRLNAAVHRMQRRLLRGGRRSDRRSFGD